jgi:AraC family transcriptional regulator
VKNETRSFYESAVLRTVARIASSLDDALDLEAVAREAALSPFHYHRVFRGMIGETPLELHRRLRLERAAWQLLDRDASVTTIAFDAGYETHEAFTRAFRAAYGASPTAYRQSAIDLRRACGRMQPIELAAKCGVHFNASAQALNVTFVTGETIMNVTLEQMPELRVAAVHHVGPYNRIAEAFARLGAIAGPGGLLRQGAMMLAIYHDDPETTPAEQLQSDAGLTVINEMALPSGVEEQRLPAGRYAKTTHRGPYTKLGDTWTRFMGEWLPKSGHRVGAGKSFEVYRNNPTNAAPEDLVTDLYLPIA